MANLKSIQRIGQPREKLQPIEEYIQARQEEGFGFPDIKVKLKQAKYSEQMIALAEKSFRHRKTIQWMGIGLGGCIVIILILLIFPIGGNRLFSFERMDYSNPMMCAGISDMGARSECLAKVEATLTPQVLEGADPQAPGYAGHVQKVIGLAGARNDLELCNSLDAGWSGQCKRMVPYLRAFIESDASKCSQTGEVQTQMLCYYNVLEQSNPALYSESRQRLISTTQNAMASGDAIVCDAMTEEIPKKVCQTNTFAAMAIAKGDALLCQKVEDSKTRSDCLSRTSPGRISA